MSEGFRGRPLLWADVQSRAVVVTFHYRAVVSIPGRFLPATRLPGVTVLLNGLRMRGSLCVGLSVVAICIAGGSTLRNVQTTNMHVIQSTHEYQYRQR